MTEHTHQAGLSDFAARLQANKQAITADFIDYIKDGHLHHATAALHAAHHAIEKGPPTSENLLKIAEAAITAGRYLDTMAKACGAQAAHTDHSVRDIARRLSLGTTTIATWMEGREAKVALPDDIWWIDDTATTTETAPADSTDTSHPDHPEPNPAAAEPDAPSSDTATPTGHTLSGGPAAEHTQPREAGELSSPQHVLPPAQTGHVPPA